MGESSPAQAEQPGPDPGCNCRHVASLHWLEKPMKTIGVGGGNVVATSIE